MSSSQSSQDEDDDRPKQKPNFSLSRVGRRFGKPRSANTNSARSHRPTKRTRKTSSQGSSSRPLSTSARKRKRNIPIPSFAPLRRTTKASFDDSSSSSSSSEDESPPAPPHRKRRTATTLPPYNPKLSDDDDDSSSDELLLSGGRMFRKRPNETPRPESNSTVKAAVIDVAKAVVEKETKDTKESDKDIQAHDPNNAQVASHKDNSLCSEMPQGNKLSRNENANEIAPKPSSDEFTTKKKTDDSSKRSTTKAQNRGVAAASKQSHSVGTANVNPSKRLPRRSVVITKHRLKSILQTYMDGIDPQQVTLNSVYRMLRKDHSMKMTLDLKKEIKKMVMEMLDPEASVSEIETTTTTGSPDDTKKPAKEPPKAALSGTFLEPNVSAGQANNNKSVRDEISPPTTINVKEKKGESKDENVLSTKPNAAKPCSSKSNAIGSESDNGDVQVFDAPQKNPVSLNSGKLEVDDDDDVQVLDGPEKKETSRNGKTRASKNTSGENGTGAKAGQPVRRGRREKQAPVQKKNPAARARASCTFCSNCPGCTRENGGGDHKPASLSLTDAAVERTLIRQLEKIEKANEMYALQEDALRRKLKSHRRDMWRKRERLVNVGNESWFLPEAEALDEQLDKAEKRQLVPMKTVRLAQSKLFPNTKKRYQPTLTQLMAGEQEEDQADLGTKVTGITNEQASADTLEMTEAAVAEETLDEEESQDSISCDDYGGFQSDPEDVAQTRHRLDFNQPGGYDIEASNSAWSALSANLCGSTFDELFMDASELVCGNLEELIHICEDLEGRENQVSADSHAVSLSELDERDRVLAEGVIAATKVNEEALDGVNSMFHDWEENMLFLFRADDDDVSDALDQIEETQKRLEKAKLNFAAAMDKRIAGLEVFAHAAKKKLDGRSVEDGFNRSEDVAIAETNTERNVQDDESYSGVNDFALSQGFFPTQAETAEQCSLPESPRSTLGAFEYDYGSDSNCEKHERADSLVETDKDIDLVAAETERSHPDQKLQDFNAVTETTMPESCVPRSGTSINTRQSVGSEAPTIVLSPQRHQDCNEAMDNVAGESNAPWNGTHVNGRHSVGSEAPTIVLSPHQQSLNSISSGIKTQEKRQKGQPLRTRGPLTDDFENTTSQLVESPLV